MRWFRRYRTRQARRAEHRALRLVNAHLNQRDLEVPTTLESALLALALWRLR